MQQQSRCSNKLQLCCTPPTPLPSVHIHPPLLLFVLQLHPRHEKLAHVAVFPNISCNTFELDAVHSEALDLADLHLEL